MNLEDQAIKSFTVQMMIDNEPAVPCWVASCPELGIFTEEKSCHLLQQRVWTVAPEMFALQGYGRDSDDFSLNFVWVNQLTDK